MTRLYPAEWDALSRAVIAASPECESCGKTTGERYVNARGVPRSVRLTVDHIRPVSEGGSNARSNLRVLCASCHGERTAGSWSRR